MRRLLTPGAAVVLLAGCAVPSTPPPESAAVVAPEAWRSDLAGTAPLDTEWWRGFGGPTLDALVARALEHNPDVATAVARVREARAQERQARAALLPTLDASLSENDARSVSAFGLPTESASGQPVVQAAYEVDLFGRISDQVSAAREAALSSLAARDTVKLSVAAATASGYLTLCGLRSRLRVAQDTLRVREWALRLSRDRGRVGYISALEVRQAEVEYQSAALIPPQVLLAIGRQENALRLLTGDVPGAVHSGEIEAIAPPPLPQAGLPSELLRRRPDIAQAERTLAASDATLSVARKQFLPSVRLSASAGAVFNSALPDPITIWSVGGSILAPLFHGGELRAGVESAAARRDQAAFAYQKATLTAFREVEDALAAITQLARQREVQEAQRANLQQTVRQAGDRYEAGYASVLERIDAERALLTAELNLVQLRTDELTARVTLYQALGGGWREEQAAR
ncbi:efflux transporter outer membrane subunit [Novosphingobium sp. BL-52-GroH]|uniref:efflux transporter outer membrane subunit n=1 Tax=Novosphingobium sp. BL-52-GroH TaxID=3349877 RepID=UPI0038512247